MKDSDSHRNQPLYRSFICALSGIGSALSRERNLRIHLAAGAAALYFASVYGLARGEWAVLLLAVGLVLVCELLNTAVERLTDLACHREPHPLAKAAKDIAAGAVLVSACVSAGVGLCLFGDLKELSRVFGQLAAQPALPLLILAAAVVFILWPQGGRGKG